MQETLQRQTQGLAHSYEMRIMRGLAILMILLHHALSHTEQTHGTVMLTYALNHVHVVVFFVLAGVLFEYKKTDIYQNGFWAFARNKSRRLLLPYLFWSLLLAIGVKIASQLPTVASLIDKLGYREWSIGEIVWNTLTMQDYYTQHLWFIYVLFFIYLANAVAKEGIANVKAFLLLFALVNILSLAGVSLPFLLDRFLQHLCNFLFGRLMFRFRVWDKLPQKRVTALSLLIIAVLESLEYFSLSDFSYTCLGNFIWGIAGTQVILAVACLASKKAKLVAAWLCRVGNASYPIYLLHNPYIVSGLSVVFSVLGITAAAPLYVVLCMIIGVWIPALVYGFLSARGSRWTLVLGG